MHNVTVNSYSVPVRSYANEIGTWSVTASLYATIPQNYAILELFQKNARNEIVCMQDGAPLHMAKSVHGVLEQHFGDRIITRYFPFPWPPWSLDLSPMCFFIWGYIKSRVYMCNPQTLSDLKDPIKREIANILQTMLHSVLLSPVSRM